MTFISRSPWESLRAALDDGLEVEGAQDYDPHVVHDQDYFKRLQNSANHR